MSGSNQSVIQRLGRLLGRIAVFPPPLRQHFSTPEFYTFMRDEIGRYSPRYARTRVRIEPADRLDGLSGGAILAFLHYGSFFLSGGAITHQLGRCYTAMVSRRNLIPEVMSVQDIAYWRRVHIQVSRLYRAPVLFSDQPARDAIRWLGAGNLLGMALDVREHGQRHKEARLRFLGEDIYMQLGPARLAHAAGVPLVPMSIRYDAGTRCHRLSLGAPIWVDESPHATTQRLLDFLQQDPAQAPEQLFHDIARTFRTPAQGG